MIPPDSPLKSIPSNLDRKQVFFLDGIRHSAEICQHSFYRLTKSLSELVNLQECGKNTRSRSFSEYFLDAWAFVDAADRFRCLYQLQPEIDEIVEEYSPKAIRERLSDIRSLRNIIQHAAQKSDKFVSRNSAALGELTWATIINETPPRAKSCVIRPGILTGIVEGPIAALEGPVRTLNSTADVTLTAIDASANLTEAYFCLAKFVGYMQSCLKREFKKNIYKDPFPSDMFCYRDLISKRLKS